MAKERLLDENILFEGQFPFLNDASMPRSRKLIRAFKHFGLEKDIHCLSWKFEKQGFMYCLFFMGNKFSTLQEVKKYL